MNSLAWATSLAVLLAVAPVAASDPPLPDVSQPCAPEVTADRSFVLAHDGQAGVWFHMEVARCMLGRLAALPLYAQRVSLLEGRLQLDDERTALVVREVSLAEEGEQRAVNALSASERGRRHAEDAKDAWYRAPALWFALGVIAAVAIGFVVVYGLQAVSP